MNVKYYQFSEEHATAFEAAAMEYYDFQTCQRGDGSYYGTGGQCRKGTPVDGVEKGKKLDAEGAEKLLSGKLKNDINSAMSGVDSSMDDIALELIDQNFPSDARKIEKYDEALEPNSPLNRAIDQAEAKSEASQNTIGLQRKIDEADMAKDKAIDKFDESGDPKDAEKMEKRFKELKDSKQELVDEVAKFDSQTAELKDKLAKEDAKLDKVTDKYGVEDPRWDKQFDKFSNVEGKLEKRAMDLATDTPASRRVDKQLSDRLDKLEKTKASVEARRDELMSRREDKLGNMTSNDIKAVYSLSRGGQLNSGKYDSDMKSWTNNVYKQLKAAGYDVKKSDVKNLIEDTLLTTGGEAGFYRSDSFYSGLADLT